MSVDFSLYENDGFGRPSLEGLSKRYYKLGKWSPEAEAYVQALVAENAMVSKTTWGLWDDIPEVEKESVDAFFEIGGGHTHLLVDEWLIKECFLEGLRSFRERFGATSEEAIKVSYGRLWLYESHFNGRCLYDGGKDKSLVGVKAPFKEVPLPLKKEDPLDLDDDD